MPVYEYKCKNCKYEAVLNESIKASRVKTCPMCKVKDSLERKISRSNFILKGAGWYSNDKH